MKMFIREASDLGMVTGKKCAHCGADVADSKNHIAVFVTDETHREDDIVPPRYYCDHTHMMMHNQSLVDVFIQNRFSEDYFNHLAKDQMHCWWGLSYAAWLTIPRVVIQQMPPEWQARLSALLEEYEDAVKNHPEVGTRVQLTDTNGKLIKTPEWMVNYRHPDQDKINHLFGVQNEDQTD